MRRNFLTGLLICLIPTLLAGLAVGLAFQREARGVAGFRRGIDLAGGSILVYEVDLERSLRQKDTTATREGLSNEEIRRLADNIKRRIDPNDLFNVVVRPVGTTRVEVIIPFSGTAADQGKEVATADTVQQVKETLRQVGLLEFRIVANTTDDADGITDTRALLARASTDPKIKSDLEELAQRGLPPLASPTNYTVTVNGEAQDNVSYEWVPLGKEERESYGLSNAYAIEPPPKKPGTSGSMHFYPEMEGVRKANGGALAKAGAMVAIGRNVFFTREYSRVKGPPSEEGMAVEYFLLTRLSPSDAVRVDRDMGLVARAGEGKNGGPAVDFSFNATGADRFGRITARNVADPATKFERQLAIVMDGRIISAPNLSAGQAPIRDQGQISGNFTQAAVNRLVFLLRSGALNAELKSEPVSENSILPTLGQDTISKGLRAVGFSFFAVLAFMVVYYRFAGIVACIALFVNLLLTVGFMVAVQAAFTLPGLAGVVLMLGMAVDANVLIYERIREEREKGATLGNAIRLGYDRAFATIIDTHLTSIFTCIVLYAFGNDNLKGFSISLTVGLIISLFTALYVTRLIFDYALAKRYITELRMMKLFARPNFDFMGIRKAMFALTATLTVLGTALFLYRGDTILNVDFTKGTVYGGRMAPGEERALNDTDKRGLLSLVNEAAQRERLQVKEVTWLRPEVAEDGTPGEVLRRTAGGDYVYEITYADGAKAVATLANAPDGATDDEKRADVARRASTLPGVSVEQMFSGGDTLVDGKSPAFTIRTTEREPELVQVMLDRLLRDSLDSPSLIASTKVVNQVVAGPVATVTLDKPSSPKYLQGFVERELKRAGRFPTEGSSIGVEVTGVPSPDAGTAADEEKSGQFHTLKVSVASSREFAALNEAAQANKPLGDKGTAEAKDFEAILGRALRAFEARPIPERLETFDPALAADTRNRAFYAIVASWAAVLVFLWFRFGNWTFGAAAVVCLIHDLAFTLGAIAVCHYLYDNPFGRLFQLHDFKIDLAAVAALLTLVGYSVNDTIVVFDRIREVRGKNPALTPQIINDSVNQTLSRTVLAALTVFLVVVVLYFFGGEGIHLFSFVMVMGVLVGTYSSIYIAAPMLLILGEGKPRADARLPQRPIAAPVSGPVGTVR